MPLLMFIYLCLQLCLRRPVWMINGSHYCNLDWWLNVFNLFYVFILLPPTCSPLLLIAMTLLITILKHFVFKLFLCSRYELRTSGFNYFSCLSWKWHKISIQLFCFVPEWNESNFMKLYGELTVCHCLIAATV